MALRIPDQQIAYIRKFLQLPEDRISAFLNALDKAGPQFNFRDLSEEVSVPWKYHEILLTE
jgi:hypothetical protein